MIIKNVKVYTEDHTFRDGMIGMQGGVLDRVCLSPGHSDFREGETVVDGEGRFVVPGLIDTHFHGCMGYDFCDGTEEALKQIAEYELSVGVTAMAPATMTLPVEELEEILAVAYKYAQGEQGGADLVGVNMEGPFISREKKGAQAGRHIIHCDEGICRRFLEASGGLVKCVGIAPEENEGFLRFIAHMKDRVGISLAHTNADYDTAKAAFDAGASRAVHLYNAMPAFTHRSPGVVGAVADSPHVMAELICDGVHIHPSVVRATMKMLGTERVIFISDSMRATGMPDGRYTLGGQEVDVAQGRATLSISGVLAGSATNLFECMKTAVLQMGLPLEEAVACATENPAKSLGLYGQRGSLSVGKKADVLLFDDRLERRLVIKDGRVASGLS